jgi:hypothetical protein
VRTEKTYCCCGLVLRQQELRTAAGTFWFWRRALRRAVGGTSGSVLLLLGAAGVTGP